MITFALSSAAGKSLIFKNGSTEILGITNLGAISTSGNLLVVDNVKTAVRLIANSITNVIVKKDTLSHTFFTMFAHIDNPSMTDGISYRVVDTSSSKVWAEGKVAVSPDGGLENILTTTGLLTRMTQVTGTDAINPVNETPGASTSDSIAVKLLSGILFHSVIAHNSPKLELAEEDNGIFTNYIQYFDNIVRNWSSVNDSAIGLTRLRNIYYRVLTQNAGIITDPVWALNHGTLAEFGKPVQERKNYAFYEGYSRLYFDLEKPVYSTGVNAGAGVQFKISDNIELYKANLADTFNMFDTVIINGAVARRLIVTAKDTVLNKVTADGLWVKGIEPDDENDKKDKIWYTGVNAVRLPIRNMLSGGVKVDTAFLIGCEKMGAGDVAGKVVGGGGRSLLRVYALSKNNEILDTIENIEEPGVLLHGQKRKLVYNSDYLNGNTLNFRAVTAIEDTGKIFIESHSGNNAILADTSVTAKNWFALANVTMNGILVQSIGLEGATRRLGMKDVVNGNLEVWCDNVVPIIMETDDAKLIRGADRKKLEIVLRVTGGVKLFNSAAMTQQILPDINNLLKAKREGDDYIVSWNNYADVFLKQNSIYATIKPGIAGKFEIIARWKKTKQEDAKEMIDVLGVPKIESIEFTSDHEDDKGNNVLRYETNTFLSDGQLVRGPEWFFDSLVSKPTSQTLNTNLDIEMVIESPINASFKIIGNSNSIYFEFAEKDTNLTKGQNKVILHSKIPLPNYITKIDDKVNWQITCLNYKGLNLNVSSIHCIYTTFDKPKTANSANYEIYVTSKRMDLIMQFTKNLTDYDNVALRIRSQMHDRLPYFFKQPVIKTTELWKIWDYEALYPYPIYPPREVEGGQCAQMAILLEHSIRLLGLEAIYVHLKPSKEYIRVNTFLSPDGTWIENKPPHIQCMAADVDQELLYFYFPTFTNHEWQNGEGSVYFNNRMYPLFAGSLYSDTGSIKECARNTMNKLEHANGQKLQRWCLHLKSIKRRSCAINGFVDIPTKLDP